MQNLHKSNYLLWWVSPSDVLVLRDVTRGLGDLNPKHYFIDPCPEKKLIFFEVLNPRRPSKRLLGYLKSSRAFNYIEPRAREQLMQHSQGPMSAMVNKEADAYSIGLNAVFFQTNKHPTGHDTKVKLRELYNKYRYDFCIEIKGFVVKERRKRHSVAGPDIPTFTMGGEVMGPDSDSGEEYTRQEEHPA